MTLKELLGPELPDLETIKTALIAGFVEGLGIEAAPGEITEAEERLAKEAFDDEIGSDEFVAEIDDPASDDEVLAGTHTGAGGTIDAFVKLEGQRRDVLQRVLISGDFFVTPPRIVFDLEASLMGVKIDEVDDTIDEFFARTEVGTLSVSPADFRASIASALGAGNG